MLIKIFRTYVGGYFLKALNLNSVIYQIPNNITRSVRLVDFDPTPTKVRYFPLLYDSEKCLLRENSYNFVYERKGVRPRRIPHLGHRRSISRVRLHKFR